MSYPQLIVWALEMRRMMGIRVPEGVIGRLKETYGYDILEEAVAEVAAIRE